MLFRSEDEVNAWCERTGQPRGEILSLAQTWTLSQLWYHDRLEADFHGRTADEARQIFQRLGLTSPAWSLQPADESSSGNDEADR
ncbi:MAG TPA: hypothetical protein VFQ32_02460 [Ktedonobacterales bacterium]|nr:hypothetical protein [Ktedonobacterales bacterium]